MGARNCSGGDFYVTQEGHPNYFKTYFMNILRCFDDHEASKLTSFCLNLIMSSSFINNAVV